MSILNDYLNSLVAVHSRRLALVGYCMVALAVAGCGQATPPPAPASVSATEQMKQSLNAQAAAASAEQQAARVAKEAERIAVNLAELTAEDLPLAEAQGYCAINTRGKLGFMGVPVKITLKDQPVFLCCDHCREKAEADPDATLAMVASLKEKTAAEKSATDAPSAAPAASSDPESATTEPSAGSTESTDTPVQ